MKSYSSLVGNITRRAGAIALAAVAVQTTASAVSLSLIPSTSVLTPGGTVQIQIQVSGLGDAVAPSLGAADLNVQYDPASFTFSSANYGDPTLGDALGLGTPSVHDVTHDAGGARVNLFSVSLDTEDDLNQLQPGAFVLGVLTFTASGLGTGAFSLTDVLLSDAAGGELAWTALSGTRVTVQSAGGLPVPDSGMTMPALFLAGFAWAAARFGRSGRMA